MTHIRRRSFAALLVVGALTAAGCGSSSSTAPTAAEFRAQADAICKDTNTKIDALGTPTTAAEFKDYFDKAYAIQIDEATKLKALTPSSDLKATWDETMKLADQLDTLLGTAKARVDGGESATSVVSAMDAQITPVQDQMKQKAKDLGLTVCGTNSSDSGSTTSTTSTAPAPTTTTSTSTTSTTSTTDTGTTASVGTVGTSVFLADINTFASTLTQFGMTLQAAAAGPSALKERAPMMAKQLDAFDAVIKKMGGYTIDVPALERKRAAIVAASPDISRLGRDLLDAAQKGDATKVTSIASEMKAALERLQKAATA